MWWWSGLVLLVNTSRARSDREIGPMTHSDPQICHKKRPLSPAPRPSSIAAQYAIQGRLGLLDSAGFGVGSGLSLSAQADHAARLAS